MVNNSAYTSEPTVAQLLSGLANDARELLRQELALAKHEVRQELRNIILAVTSLGIGIGMAAIGGLLLILMLVHLLHALTMLPLWACYAIVGGLFTVVGVVLLIIGKKKLAQIHMVPQGTVETMKENAQWIKQQVTADGISKRAEP